MYVIAFDAFVLPETSLYNFCENCPLCQQLTDKVNLCSSLDLYRQKKSDWSVQRIAKKNHYENFILILKF